MNRYPRVINVSASTENPMYTKVLSVLSVLSLLSKERMKYMYTLPFFTTFDVRQVPILSIIRGFEIWQFPVIAGP